MRTIGIVRTAARAPRCDLLPRLRAGLALPQADERVQLALPAFTWPWRIAALAAVCVPFVVPDPLRFLAASGLL
jgi:hypothetical protein